MGGVLSDLNSSIVDYSFSVYITLNFYHTLPTAGDQSNKNHLLMNFSKSPPQQPSY